MSTLSHGRGWLADDAAASIHRIDAEIGGVMQITDAGRTREQQEEEYAKDPNNAAPPGESPHETGKAVDSNQAQHHADTMHRHGWRRPIAREWWHWVYWPALDQHINDPTPKTNQEEEMTATFINIQGRSGSHRGGCYAIMRDNNGSLFARFVSPTIFDGVPTVPNTEYEAWANTMPIR